jgi:hypothetical protein
MGRPRCASFNARLSLSLIGGGDHFYGKYQIYYFATLHELKNEILHHPKCVTKSM